MSIKSLAEKIGMDYETVLEDFCGDVSALKDALRKFPSSCDAELLKKSVDTLDTENVKKEAHKIRKIAEKLGLENLRIAAARLEEVNPEKIPADYNYLASIYQKTLEAIEEEKL